MACGGNGYEVRGPDLMAERDPNTEARERLAAWLDDIQLSNQLGCPHYANLGELKRDLRELLAALERAERALEQEREKVRKSYSAIYSVWRSALDYGVEGCTCGLHATPDRDCHVHLSLERLERSGFDYDQSRRALEAFLAPSPGAAAETETSG